LNSLAVVLVLSSCAIHAGWNLLAKNSSKTPAFFLIGYLVLAAALTPAFLALGGARMAAAPAGMWICLLLSGVFLTAYFACLAAAYRHGDVSVAYPLIRTTPVFVLLLAGLVLKQHPTWPAVLGVGLAVAGCFLLQFRKLGLGPEACDWRVFLSRTSLWALAAALASSGYTLADDVGMDLISRVAPGARGAFFYNYLEFVAVAAGLLAVALYFDRPAGVMRVWRAEKLNAVAVGAMIFGAYLLILWAYLNADKVAYVAGLRQLSIVLGVLGGIAFFGEPGGKVRLTASIVIVAGLILIALAR